MIAMAIIRQLSLQVVPTGPEAPGTQVNSLLKGGQRRV